MGAPAHPRPRRRGFGHLVEGGGRTVYVSGDTDLVDEMHLLGDRGVDVALLPVWGWGPASGPGHLDPAGRPRRSARLRPRVAVPVHWGTLAVPGSSRLPGLRGRMARLLVEPPRAFAAAVAGPASTPTWR